MSCSNTSTSDRDDYIKAIGVGLPWFANFTAKHVTKSSTCIRSIDGSKIVGLKITCESLYALNEFLLHRQELLVGGEGELDVTMATTMWRCYCWARVAALWTKSFVLETLFHAWDSAPSLHPLVLRYRSDSFAAAAVSRYYVFHSFLIHLKKGLPPLS